MAFGNQSKSSNRTNSSFGNRKTLQVEGIAKIKFVFVEERGKDGNMYPCVKASFTDAGNVYVIKMNDSKTYTLENGKYKGHKAHYGSIVKYKEGR